MNYEIEKLIEEFREHFKSVYFGKDDYGAPRYALEDSIEEAIPWLRRAYNLGRNDMLNEMELASRITEKALNTNHS